MHYKFSLNFTSGIFIAPLLPPRLLVRFEVEKIFSQWKLNQEPLGLEACRLPRDRKDLKTSMMVQVQLHFAELCPDVATAHDDSSKEVSH